MKEVKFKITYERYKDDLIVALSNCGYKVQVITEQDKIIPSRQTKWLIVEVESDDIYDGSGAFCAELINKARE